MFDFIIIGGGIIGLSTGVALGKRFPSASIVLLEKETRLAAHQTGRNSGVIHSGLYYAPGSLKARLSVAGNASMQAFCQEHGVPFDMCGKLVVATSESELPQLRRLHERGIANGLAVQELTPEEAREIEPHVRCVGALRIPSTGIVDYARVCEKLATLMREQGAEIRMGSEVLQIQAMSDGSYLETTSGHVAGRYLINCAGLLSDRMVRLAGLSLPARIVPFRGEYYELSLARRHLVNHLIYPVPNTAFPFLGVHFTRMIDGTVHAGPNAVLALKREGYRKRDVDIRDAADALTYPGFWRLAAKHWRDGLQEMMRSAWKPAFVKSLQALVPDLRAADLVPTHAGVRAQALFQDGRLVEDFLFIPGPRSLHVCNAPSPAATASLELGRCIVDRVAAGL